MLWLNMYFLTYYAKASQHASRDRFEHSVNYQPRLWARICTCVQIGPSMSDGPLSVGWPQRMVHQHVATK